MRENKYWVPINGEALGLTIPLPLLGRRAV